MHYGLDTSDYTFGYIAGWSSGKELPELSASLTTIQKTANEIISGIDEQLAELEKDKQQIVTNDKETVHSVDGLTELSEKEAAEGAKVFKQKDKPSDISTADIPTVDELEKKAKSGKSISLMDLAAATKREQSGQKGKSAERKPSIRQQLAENKAKSEKTKAAPTKKKEDISL